mmetsp:Transcript_14812/g.21183  ORF Transcript_14812/g.21183 Transcript_14812/m.21183 type:complete len:225 (-) Transcript_14812:126-800(-)|eukprot:CAMPEP_0184868004 /NCGR_PEP_ID=MMETSP0580-20130426/28697_1 /TAXON_ID=1118495 /ORGANISM="Dactyliosolen fragilissimus" /LENGTH=224 /DNA_ID=CAMNT_0027368603 /DNA_START=23 /DNA_END=697 /DNA_ORIENTATION=+
MGSTFSSQPAAKVSTRRLPKESISNIDRAVLDLKNSRDRLTRYKNKLKSDSDNLLLKAKQCQDNKDTKLAVGLLRLRKYKLREAENVDMQLLTILEMVSNIQTKEEEVKVISALKSGKDALAKLHQETTVDDVLKLMDEVEEQNEIERQINHILSNENLTDAEDAEVEAELAAIEAELQSNSLRVGDESTIELPLAPDLQLPKLNQSPKSDEKVNSSNRIAVAS